MNGLFFHRFRRVPQIKLQWCYFPSYRARGPLYIAFPLVEKIHPRKSAKSADENPSRRVNLCLHLLGALSIWWWANFHGRSLCEWSWAPCRTRKTIRYCPGTDGGDPLHRRYWRRWRKTSRQGSPGLGSRSNSSKASSSACRSEGEGASASSKSVS